MFSWPLRNFSGHPSNPIENQNCQWKCDEFPKDQYANAFLARLNICWLRPKKAEQLPSWEWQADDAELRSDDILVGDKIVGPKNPYDIIWFIFLLWVFLVSTSGQLMAMIRVPRKYFQNVAIYKKTWMIQLTSLCQNFFTSDKAHITIVYRSTFKYFWFSTTVDVLGLWQLILNRQRFAKQSWQKTLEI